MTTNGVAQVYQCIIGNTLVTSNLQAMAQPVNLVLLDSRGSFHVASASSNAGGFSVWCPPGIFAHLTRHNTRLHFQPDQTSGASFIDVRPPFPLVEFESIATFRITDLSSQSFLPGAHAVPAYTCAMPALAPPIDLVVGWSQRSSLDAYVAALATPSYQTYGAGDRVLVFAQLKV